jgi:hypothetical protein
VFGMADLSESIEELNDGITPSYGADVLGSPT